MSGAAPLVRPIHVTVPATTLSERTIIGQAPVVGSVIEVRYIPEAALVASASKTRTLTLRNVGQAGHGDTVVATLFLDDTKSLPGLDETDIPLIGDIAVQVGDILVWDSTGPAGAGNADPGGQLRVTVSRY